MLVEMGLRLGLGLVETEVVKIAISFSLVSGWVIQGLG